VKKAKEHYTLWFDSDIPEISYIDQTLLPETYLIQKAGSVQDLAHAIRCLAIRGAPALGVAGAYGVALAACLLHTDDYPTFVNQVLQDADYLKETRPTAVNLFYGIERVLKRIVSADTVALAQQAAITEAYAIAEEDEMMCRGIGKTGLSIVPDNCTILTHCNAGALACSTWGTALGVIRSAVAARKNIRVFACETRPLLQGARLTAWELVREGISVTVITDSMAAMLMRKKKIDLVIVGADRITKDAVFNKIGTYMHAVCASYHSIPFYVAAPLSTFDMESCEEDITIEERSRDEIATCNGKITIPSGVPVYNPAFDATPVQMVTGIITEFGLLHLPDDWNQVQQQIIKKTSDGEQEMTNDI